jgi:hypothetical protein
MIKILISKLGQLIWQFSEIRHLICQLTPNEGKDSKIACNPCIVMVTGFNLIATNNLSRRHLISQSTFPKI